MLVVTAVLYGERSILKAATVASLARQLWMLCPFWTHGSAQVIAGRLARREVVFAPDYEAAFLPGEFDVGLASPVEVEGWVPKWAAEW